MRTIIVIFLLLAPLHSSWAQSITQHLQSHDRISTIKGIVQGDSLLLLLSGNVPGSFSSQWISSNGLIRSVGLKQLYTLGPKAYRKCQLIGASNVDGDTFYYVTSQRKANTIEAFIQRSHLSDVGDLQQVRYSGRLLGAYVEDDLYLVTSKKDFTVTITHVHGTTVTSESTYPLPAPLYLGYRSCLTLRDGQSASTEQFKALIKIVHSKDKLYVVYDLYNYVFKDDDTRSVGKTYVMRIDLPSRKSELRVFAENSFHKFNSIVMNDVIFRSFIDGRIQIIEFDSPSTTYDQQRLYKNDDLIYYKRTVPQYFRFRRFNGSDSVDARQSFPLQKLPFADAINVAKCCWLFHTQYIPMKVDSTGIVYCENVFAYRFNRLQNQDIPSFSAVVSCYLAGNFIDGFSLRTTAGVARQKADDHNAMKGQWPWRTQFFAGKGIVFEVSQEDAASKNTTVDIFRDQ